MSLLRELWDWIKEQVDNWPECKHRRTMVAIGNTKKCIRCKRLIHQ